MTILLFAAAREAAGCAETSVDLPAGASVQSALDATCPGRADLAALLPSCRFAVDEVFAARTTLLRDGATLAVLPPVSGG